MAKVGGLDMEVDTWVHQLPASHKTPTDGGKVLSYCRRRDQSKRVSRLILKCSFCLYVYKSMYFIVLLQNPTICKADLRGWACQCSWLGLSWDPACSPTFTLVRRTIGSMQATLNVGTLRSMMGARMLIMEYDASMLWKQFSVCWNGPHCCSL